MVWFSESEEALAAGSAPWVERAARAGSSEAQFILAGFHYRGEFGAPLDLAAAVRWFQMSAEGGSALGMLWMATLYANGEGVPRDESKAIYFWRQAAEQVTTLHLHPPHLFSFSPYNTDLFLSPYPPELSLLSIPYLSLSPMPLRPCLLTLAS